jgi:hypothetical protein
MHALGSGTYFEFRRRDGPFGWSGPIYVILKVGGPGGEPTNPALPFGHGKPSLARARIDGWITGLASTERELVSSSTHWMKGMG